MSKVKYGKPRVVSHKDLWANDNPDTQRVSRERLMQARNYVLINHLFATKEEDRLTEEEITEICVWFDKLRDMPDTGDISCLTDIPEKVKKHLKIQDFIIYLQCHL